MIDLELADYQRSVEGLRKELEEKKVSMAKLEEKLVLESNQREQVQREKGMHTYDIITANFDSLCIPSVQRI